MAHIQLLGIDKAFGANQVLRGCSLAVEQRETLTLLGPSGCGKTTLLRVVAGFLEPDAGQVIVGGRDITWERPNRRDVGFVFQNYALFPHLTVRRNVAYGLAVRRIGRAEAARRVDAALDLVSLTDFASRYPAQLSGGQQQRVAIARSLVLEPQVLLLDEPFNALDAKLRHAMQVELRKLITRLGITAIFVTHDQDEALTISDRIVVMRKGSIEQVAPPLEIYDRPANAYVANFIGRANVVEERVAAGRVAAIPGLAAARGDGPAAIVIRPENLALDDRAAAGGWRGVIAFASARGPTVEYEIDIGRGRPLRVVESRRAGCPVRDSGTTITARVIDPAACVLLEGAADGGE
jgi:ABC-type Fe3+/spermidine/putrescine transport system ATPase subunit